MPLPELKHRFRHDCDLPDEEKVFKLATPYDTRWKKIKNYFKEKMLVTRYTESRRYLRSYKEFLSAKKTHVKLLEYKCIIHPLSPIAKTQGLIMTVLWFVMIHWDFFMGSFYAKELLHEPFPILKKIHLCLNLVFLLDIVTSFYTGYTIEKTRSIVMGHDQIVRNYLKTYFIFDFFPVFGALMYFIFPVSYRRTRWLFYQLHVFRLVRVKAILRKIEILIAFKVHDAGRLLAMLAITCEVVLYVLTSISNMFRVVEHLLDIPCPDNFVKLYENEHPLSSITLRKNTTMRGVDLFFMHSTAVVYHFVGVTSSQHTIRNPHQQLFFTIVIMIGLCVYLYAIAKVLQFFSVKNISEARYDELIMQADAFMIQKSFPRKLRHRIFEYYNYKYHKKFFCETTILGTFSEHLQMEVLLYSCQHLIDTVQMFKGLSKAAVGSILALLQQETYVPGDVILSPENADGCMYFILFGTCGIQLPNGREVLHIEDGDYFGYPADDEAWAACNFDYSVVALEMARVFKMEPKDVQYCCRLFPEIETKLESMEKVRNRKYNKMFDLITEDDDEKTDDIITELRRGKILARGLQRLQFTPTSF